MTLVGVNTCPPNCIEPYDMIMETGFCYIETNNVIPCPGNGWYADVFICDALRVKLITHDDIKYQIKSSRMLNPRFVEDFINAIVSSFTKCKQGINRFIRI